MSTMATTERKDTSLRVRGETHAKLAWLAEQAQMPLTQYLEHLAEQERRRVLLEGCNQAFALLRADPVRLAAYEADLGPLDALAGEGLSDNANEQWEFGEPPAT